MYYNIYYIECKGFISSAALYWLEKGRGGRRAARYWLVKMISKLSPKKFFSLEKSIPEGEC